MFAGTALSVRLLVYAGLSLFIISGPYLYMVVCVLYTYNLTIQGSVSISVSVGGNKPLVGQFFSFKNSRAYSAIYIVH